MYRAISRCKFFVCDFDCEMFLFVIDLVSVVLKVMALEYVGVAPKGSLRVSSFLEKAAEGLVAGGK